MADTTFASGTLITSPWLNEINDAIHNQTSGLSGAVPRTLASKLGEVISVDDYGAVGDGTTDDYTAISNAQDALVNRGGGTLLFTSGKTYKIGTSLTMKNGITYRGSGKSSTDSNGASMGARIISTTTDLFVNTGAITAGVTFKDLWLESQSGGGHIFSWTGSGLVAKIEFDGCVMFQYNAAKSVINGQATNGVFSIYYHHSEYQYLVANSVPAIHLKSNTINSITINDFWSHCSSGATSGTYSIWIESTNASGAAYNVNIKQGVFEVPGGGCINLLSCRNSIIEDCTVYDLVTTPNNPMFKIAKGASGPTSSQITVRGVRSVVGTAAKPDLQIDMSVAGQSGFKVENCNLNWYDGVSANVNGAVHVANSISNYENAGFLELGSSNSLDLRWINQGASAHTYALWNGAPGLDNGYLNIYQDGAYAGAISPTGLFQWGGSLGDPAFYVTQTGAVNSKLAIFPGNMSGAAQGVCGLRAGSGAPDNGVGQNGDYYFRSDTPGTANQRIYVKAAGTWTGIV